MAKITIVDNENVGLPAVIFKGGTPMASATIDGEVELSNGSYVAKIIGYEDTPFNVNGDAYVVIKSKGFEGLGVEITARPTAWKKWVKLGVIGLCLFGLIKLIIKK